jgi:thymidylate synthase
MFNLLTAMNAARAWPEMMWKMRVWGQKENSRNGPVWTSPYPVGLAITNPTERVIFCAERDANPFFHVMEAVWMFGGMDKVEPLLVFNKGYENYAESNGTVHGAYGARWRFHFHVDQIITVSQMLKNNKQDRRAMIAMWDPDVDLSVTHKDIPCNTHIYFRIVEGRLDMTVCNRSNDIVWGMLGANIVHMTMLQELIALEIGVPIGVYRVVTQNAHVYDTHAKFIQNPPVTDDRYDLYKGYPLLQPGETIEQFLGDAQLFFNEDSAVEPMTKWFDAVARPMWVVWHLRKNGVPYTELPFDLIKSEDWRVACIEWVARREK